MADGLWVGYENQYYDNPVNVYGLGNAHLFQAPIAITPQTPTATFLAAEATFDAYSAIAASPFFASNPVYGLDVIMAFFWQTVANPVSIPNTIYGFWIDDAITGEWVVGGNFGTPQNIVQPYAGLFLSVRWTLWAGGRVWSNRA
jgi:hypothetical protein